MSEIFTPIEIPTSEIDNPLEALVGPGKKFADTAALAKSKLEADSFIEQIKRENEELRREVSSKATMDEIMTQIRQFAPKPVESQQPLAPVVPSAQTPDELKTLVSQMLDQKKGEEKLSQNRKAVEDKIAEKWGSDAQLQMNKKAKELGVDLSYLQKVALESPSVFFRLVGLDAQPNQAGPVVAPRSGFTPESPTGTEVRNSKWYDSLKARDPKSYFSSKMMNQRYKDQMAQGEAF